MRWTPILILVVVATAQALADEPVKSPCQLAWERSERIRLSLGLPPDKDHKPDDETIPGVRETCELYLRHSEADERALLKEMIEICGGDCRNLIPENKR